jgi:hypothetical protein
MIYTPIGKRNISGTFCIRFQKGIVNTLRGSCLHLAVYGYRIQPV